MKFIQDLYLHSRLFIFTAIVVVAFIGSFIVSALLIIPKILFLVLAGLIIADILLLFRPKRGVHGVRFTPDKLSNGDENEIRIYLENFYPFTVSLHVIDEIPHQFQKRDVAFRQALSPRESKTIAYFLRPVKRGEYSFGSVNTFVRSPLGLVIRRFRFSSDALVPVYPSYIQMRKYELMAISNRLEEVGVKKIRRLGHNMEFEMIREYVTGDDVRTINWKATAHKSHLMVNHYQDERSQQVYSLIDKGRIMRMPFNGMSLLDYAINACLVISNIAIRKSDKAGLITFQNDINTMLPASRSNRQMAQIQEVLYNQKTGYRESDFSIVYSHIRRKITQRSLLLLFTNFESLYGMQRQLPFLRNLARQHVVVVIFFENTELTALTTTPALQLKEIYYKAVAEKFAYDKKLIVKELQQAGIQTILTAPERLTVNTINKYLELKARGMI
ncbi:DUF58 domain-containing protein [Oscillatoria amoena NRMC-F 0135]|nr:DUF58 domain-containing protein [Oscillatoria amoena NRMC-F 0135]